MTDCISRTTEFRTAVFSKDCKYRYYLTRTWDPKRSPVIFMMCNPSKATAEEDDPTICRCKEYARKWGYGGLIVVNLFAFRSPDPKTLRTADDPVGPENKESWDKAIHEARQDAVSREGPGYESPIICGWGVHGGYMNRDKAALGWLGRQPARLLALGVTEKKFPRHPLRLRKDAKRTPYLGR